MVPAGTVFKHDQHDFTIEYAAIDIRSQAPLQYQFLDEVKSGFFANISHEFRTPLTLILGPLREALSSAQQPLARTQLRMMYRNAQRLPKLISQLLDLSKLEAGGMRLHRRNQDIVAFLRLSMKLLRPYRREMSRARNPPMQQERTIGLASWSSRTTST